MTASRSLVAFRRMAEPALGVVLVILVLLSLCIGVYPVAPGTVARILLALVFPGAGPEIPSWSEAEQVTVQVIRLPRIMLALSAGMGLGMSGAALQGMMRNPLVGPDLVGVSPGAACGGVLAILFDWPPAAIVTCAFAGGVLALILASGLARLAKNGGVLALILAGVIVGAFFSAVHGLVQYLADPETKLPSMVYWLMGSFADANQRKVVILGVPLIVGGSLLLLLRWRINLLSLGDLDAASLGIPVERLRWLIIVLVSLIVSAQVSVSGIVGWVGMIVPHFARMLVGPDHRRLVPASALLGAGFLLIMDDLARSIANQEIPIGLLTAAIGTPIFAILFWKSQAKGWTHE
ncbi:iron ABC transporter permease [Telmatospirillum sp.]|uniref:FecCD family ABC transporter permease n=1 Tax=Telmatospirillum sp. TaxID=2079197 RepID=UPI00283F3CD5|nr:iron ABC transporter permease [Telmatospirillum sp.]MDR3436090.1 iron ABC transporter permease [Telmatospirillum sp.]